MTERNAGLPSVRVPVLSTISVSISRSRSIASASRNSTPAWAARPVATMIDIGVARPSAQGQAMISTATALTMAKVQAGSGPKKPQTRNSEKAPDQKRGHGDRQHRQHEPEAHPIGHALHRRA